MGELYNENLARVYDEIYQGFIDYRAEYEFYKNLCLDYNSNRILEIACGTGNLAKSFTSDFSTYVGLDFSESMLKIAKKKFPEGYFIQGDMRHLNFVKHFDTILITGRSTSYLLDNIDLIQTFKSVHTALEDKGLFIFDCINAELFITYILKNSSVVHKSTYNNKQFERDSYWVKNKNNNYHLIDWKSSYYQLKDIKRMELGEDSTLFRVFTIKEVTEALQHSGFKILEIIDRETYAFDTNLYVCQKI
ncbi:Methyltransferase domain-containing protein [Maribacter orientalis]|uniref:Methyltransferase domain-containing protein n=1 Tax=Maribacter orientalis TaxID=228957 RepID=A0A1H7UGF8_9FLAO|nr:class I SAM-dependent methyltransferase [Maribacter orientalis]SEL95846.1 Methyltransferase domain-containing protein [Maribacter orientalis]